MNAPRGTVLVGTIDMQIRNIQMKNKIVYVCTLVVVLLTLAGCGKKSDDRDDYLKIAITNNVITLDPQQAAMAVDVEIIDDCNVGLFKLNADDELVPADAENYEVSDDGLIYTFHLRDTYWSNGDPLTANDYVYAFRRGVSGQFDYSGYLGDVAHIKGADDILYNGADPENLGVYAEDEHTLIIELDTPVSFLPSILTMPICYPLNEKFMESLEEGMYATSPQNYVSNGPFTLEEYIPGTASIAVKKNPLYWDADNVTLSGISYQVVSNSGVALSAYQVGQIDFMKITGNQVKLLENDPELSEQIDFEPSSSFYYLMLNMTEDRFENVNLRAAMSCAIDRYYLTDDVLNGMASETYGVVPKEIVYNTVTGEDFSADADKYRELYADPDKKDEYFELAKKELGEDKFNIRLLALQTHSELAQALKSNLEEELPGFNITLDVLPIAEAFQKGVGHDFDIMLFSWQGDYADPTAYLDLFKKGNNYNFGLWNDDEYSNLLYECANGKYSADYEARWKALHEAEDRLLSEHAIIPLLTGKWSYLISDRVKGLEFHVMGLTDYSHVVINDEEKQ